jgi:type II secretory pathway component PulC
MRWSLPFAIAVALCACGAATAPAVTPPPGVAQRPATTAAQVAAAPTPPPPEAAGGFRLKRSAVHGVVSQGLGVFLQHVELDDQPVRVDGKFHGFRVAVLRDAKFWNGVDLKPGDVITGVNGFPIERPEQAQTAFDSLEVASELRVSYERDGKPREIVYPIVDDRP